MTVEELIEKLQSEDPKAIVTVTREASPDSYIVMEVMDLTEDVMVIPGSDQFIPTVKLLTSGQR